MARIDCLEPALDIGNARAVRVRARTGPARSTTLAELDDTALHKDVTQPRALMKVTTDALAGGARGRAQGRLARILQSARPRRGASHDGRTR